MGNAFCVWISSLTIRSLKFMLEDENPIFELKVHLSLTFTLTFTLSKKNYEYLEVLWGYVVNNVNSTIFFNN